MQTKDEMKQMLKEAAAIELSLETNMKAMKLAETRLENRCQRLGAELCMDEVYDGLCEEVKKLTHTNHQLTEKLNASKTTYNALEAHLIRLEGDLKKKQHTLMTDIRALDLRQRLKCNANNNTYNNECIQTGRNIKLTQLDSEILKS